MKYYFFCCFFFTTFISYSQTITGIFTDINNIKIETATLLFYDGGFDENVKEFAIIKNGAFAVTLKKEYTSLFIKMIANGFQYETIIIENPEKSKEYKHDFILKPNDVTQLEEVTITAKIKPFIVKKDTVSYNVDSYKDGSERKIGDIIKKLPGIDVNEESGEIKYKGRPIETVTLDGDNLFDSNYSIATKNISVDMVKAIEAIENYSENPLLKGIEQGGKVSLNLKLEQGKIDFSGDLETSAGLFDNGNFAGGFGGNLMAIKKTYKSFANVIQNNIGVNNSPFDYQGFTLNVEQIKEQEYFSQKIISETGFSNVLDESKSNINNQLFINYNSIFKINERIKIRVNIYHLNDKISTKYFTENQYAINSENFSTSDNSNNLKKPILYRGDLDIKYNTSNTSLLEYNVRFRNEEIKTTSSLIQNGSDSFLTNLNSNDLNLIQDMLWTKKLRGNKALQLSMFHSYNNISQDLDIKTPASSIIDTTTQISNFKKNYFTTQATLLAAKKRDKYTLLIGYNFNSNPFASELSQQLESSNSISTISLNDFNYYQNSIYQSGIYNLNRGKWQLTPSYTATLLTQKIKQNHTIESSDFIFSPTFKIRYSINSHSFLNGMISYDEKANSERYFFQNKVLIDTRTTIQNIQSLSLQQNSSYSLSYYLNDLYKQFQLSTKLSYRNSKGNYFSNAEITDNTIQIEYFYLPQSNDDLNFNFQISKYLNIIESNVKFNSNISQSRYKNIVNNSELRNNKSTFIRNQLLWNTGFNGPLNFENDFSWSYSKSESENFQPFIINSIENAIKIKYKPSKRWFFSFLSN
ncbi:hypothetical protein CHU92_01325 [Flavobacterium cyanobacteriorum]|uniref:Outer membrane protein beta-barrel domain-containing protein n=1 Tax=Flavobacterium cyanobacteriorum TaxID=2022802 RepID=A0A255ZZB4_9FLAO|nr:hypothetical protein [Flavobacterium cyanobacteriorum]OYQ46786.1 hypothetical protein CHU92_01325 [Flavobacterium cyanobacteriorum]